MSLNLLKSLLLRALIGGTFCGTSCLWADGVALLSSSANTSTMDKNPSWWQKLAVPNVAEEASKDPNSSAELQTIRTSTPPLAAPVQVESKSPLEKRPIMPKTAFPNWGLMLKMGLHKPSTSGWDSHYEDNSIFQLGLGASYRLINGFHLKGEVEQWSAQGKGTLNTGGLGSDIEYKMRPYRLGLFYEYARSPLTMVRPFVGSGYSYAQYQQDISDASTIKGHATGYYYEGGLLFNFYKWNPGNEPSSKSKHIFWLLGVQKNSIEVSETEIGGLSYNLGLQWRF